MKWIYTLIDIIMPTRWYIEHDPIDMNDDNSWFGPFRKKEIDDRLEGEYADLLRYGGDRLYVFVAPWTTHRKLKNQAQSREWWMEQEEAMHDDEPAIWNEDH
jgi:hypothetical protein